MKKIKCSYKTVTFYTIAIVLFTWACLMFPLWFGGFEMERVVENKPEYLVDQPFAKFVIYHEHKKLGECPEERIFSQLSHRLANAMAERMVVVKYVESPVTGAIYEGNYDYSPHDDPIGNIVYEAYLPKFNEMQARINYLEKELEKRKAYEEYYKRY